MSMAEHFLDHFMDELAAFRLQSLARGNQPLPFAQQRLELFERRAQHVRRRCDQQIVGIANGGGEIGTRVQLDRRMTARQVLRVLTRGLHRRQFFRIATPQQGRRTAPRELNRSEEQTSELQSLMRNSYAVFCLEKKKVNKTHSKDKHIMKDKEKE